MMGESRAITGQGDTYKKSGRSISVPMVMINPNA
jgi:hypothetical protein